MGVPSLSTLTAVATMRLQQAKRDLAEAIIGGDNSLISRIRPEDLEVLLG
jgi:hypothetical protein